jgi:ferritin-like metal-binding protein YciE
MSTNTFEKLFLAELKDIHSAEQQITKALPKMIKAVTSAELKSAFEAHLAETNNQIQRLDKIAEILGKNLHGKVCNGMKGVLAEGAEMLEETPEGSVRDAGVISAAQRVEHYEMAAYGAVHEYATLLGMDQIAALLKETLEEEKSADKKLSKISKNVNSDALSVPV